VPEKTLIDDFLPVSFSFFVIEFLEGVFLYSADQPNHITMMRLFSRVKHGPKITGISEKTTRSGDTFSDRGVIFQNALDDCITTFGYYDWYRNLFRVVLTR
jgi:hypothetical protein